MSDSARPRAPEVRVTIAVGAALAVQTGLALVWAGAAAERLAQLERRAETSVALVERTARLEEQTRAIRDSLDRIEAKIDRTYREDLP